MSRVPLEAPPAVSRERIRRIADFRAALRAFLSDSEQASRSAGLTPRWYLVLLFIKGARDERLNFTDLTDLLKLSRNTVTELVSRVQDAGLVTRETSPDDARVVYLRLTAEGERRLEAAIVASEQHRKRLAEKLADLVDLYDVAAP